MVRFPVFGECVGVGEAHSSSGESQGGDVGSAVGVVYVNSELQLSRIGLDLGWAAVDVVQIQLETV